MEFLAGLYTLLLVAICLLQALLLHRTGKPAARQDDEALKEWLHQQLEAQARVLEEKQAQQAQQNLAAMAHISDTLQTAVQGMSSTLTAGQNTQQQTMEQRLQGLEASNARKLEEMRRTLAEGRRPCRHAGTERPEAGRDPPHRGRAIAGRTAKAGDRKL